MLDIGWGELLVIGVVALIVVGPKDLPGLFRTVGNYMGRARGMAREFQRSMEQAADESGLKEASEGLKSVDRLKLNSATGSARKYAESLVKGIDETVANPAGGPAKPRPAPKAAPRTTRKAVAPEPSSPQPALSEPDAPATGTAAPPEGPGSP